MQDEKILHIPVLLQEVLNALNIQKDDKVLDATVGSGGHSETILNLLGSEGFLLGIDLDTDAIARAGDRLAKFDFKADFSLKQGNFAEIDKIILDCQVKRFDKILLDLGWSQDQFEKSGRGFSFNKDEPLVMSFSKKTDISAEQIVNEWSEETLRAIISGFGQERFAAKIARAIVQAREKETIKSSGQLADIINSAVPRGFYRKINPATKTFQALRMAVNRELEVLGEALEKMHEIMNPRARLAVISFHSLEDRIVKRRFKDWAKDGKGELLNKKPIVAEDSELHKNKRARSAKLRVYIKK